ncbi:hypothetical protein V6N13_061530 [Hibiscus sabdariffa]|uniref:Uncharacterized protein n=2 Tax=Hibiscus sabdariffa TaxID=183260 RepID=A0ABR2BEF7_9ROSI
MIWSYEEEISFTLGPAIPLTYEDAKFIPMAEVYAHIFRLITKLSEIEPITAREIRYRKGSYATHITTLKLSSTKVKPFIVADIETLRCGDDKVHKPYAAGLMLVRPGERINDLPIETYFLQ